MLFYERVDGAAPLDLAALPRAGDPAILSQDITISKCVACAVPCPSLLPSLPLSETILFSPFDILGSLRRRTAPPRHHRIDTAT